MSEARRRLQASRAQETAGMKRFGGVQHAGSGNQDRKGDGRVNGASWRDPDHQLVEFKRTDKRQFVLKADELELVQKQALVSGRIPVFAVEVGGRHYVLEREGDYRERLEEIAELRERLEELGG